MWICNVLKCRPPGNRDPQPVEIENCQEYLLRQVELIEPTVICTLGNFSTKLLRADPTGITRLHGSPRCSMLGSRAVRLYPIYHPAAALYTPRMLQTLREDFARIPELLALGAPEQPAPGGGDRRAVRGGDGGPAVPARERIVQSPGADSQPDAAAARSPRTARPSSWACSEHAPAVCGPFRGPSRPFLDAVSALFRAPNHVYLQDFPG